MESFIERFQATELAGEPDIHVLVDEVNRRLSECTLPLKPKTDFNFISKFLRARKYDVDVALVSIQRYYENIFRNLRRVEGIKPSNFMNAYDSNAVVVLKNKVEGAKIVYGSVRKWDANKVSLKELQCSSLFLIEEMLLDPEIQEKGNIAIIDLAGLGFSHAKQCTFTEIKNVIQMGLEGLPTRVAGIHIINAPMIYWPLHKIVLKFMPQKIRSRLHLHANLESLHEQIAKDILPISLGGNLDEEEASDKELLDKLLKYDCCYEDYWSGETSRRPRRMGRKRSSLMMYSEN